MQIEQDFSSEISAEDRLFALWPTYAMKLLAYGTARCPSWSTLLDTDDITGLSQGKVIRNVEWEENITNSLNTIYSYFRFRILLPKKTLLWTVIM